MNVSESGTKAIVKNLRSEGQTSRADYVEALQAEVTRLTAELAAARELLQTLMDNQVALMNGDELKLLGDDI